MKLTVYNGSPRGKKSNSNRIAELLCEHFDDSVAVTKHNISAPKNHDAAIAEDSDAYFVVLPLYADAMPFAVKLMLERIEENKERFENKAFYFFIHSGFPEAKQSRLLERYLKYFCKIIDAKYMGTAIMGNSEVIRYHTDKSKRLNKIKINIKGLAEDIANGRQFNEKSLKFFRGNETIPKFVLFLIKPLGSLFNKFFDRMFKQNGCYDKRYDKPYA